MASIRLNSIEETYLLGGWLAKNLSTSNVNALFLHGPLGCGKTTLIRALVSNLSGAENCEISSPSFLQFTIVIQQIHLLYIVIFIDANTPCPRISLFF